VDVLDNQAAVCTLASSLTETQTTGHEKNGSEFTLPDESDLSKRSTVNVGNLHVTSPDTTGPRTSGTRSPEQVDGRPLEKIHFYPTTQKQNSAIRNQSKKGKTPRGNPGVLL
jgi:hypothetical protein